MVNRGDPQTWTVRCGPIMLTWCRRQYSLKQRPETETSPEMKMTKFIEEVISSHNAYREQHQAPSLRHSSALSDIAQKWAENLAQSNSLQHSQATHGGERLGENISMKWSSKPENYRGTEVTDQWYSEVSMYTFGRDSGSPNTGHFSQVVWRESAEVGVGKAQTRDGKLIVVANYKPAGNVLGRYAQNVLPARGSNLTTPTSSNGRDSNRNFGPSVQHSNFPNQTNMTSMRNESGQSRSVKTYTVTEGSGPNAVTKTVVEETVTLPDGRKTTTKKETVSSGGGSRTIGQGFGGFDRDFNDRFRQMGLRNDREIDNHPGVGSSNGVSSKPASPQTMAKFREDCLRSHNTYRRKHGVSPLSESRVLTDHAQKWAEKLASSGRLTHSDCTLSNGDRLGENLAVTWSSSGGDMTGEQSADQWYREVSKMDFSRVGFSTGTGHFTQMVWKGSREFGVGKARSHDGKVFVVANYRPAGNILGEYQQNVFPLKN